MVVSKREKRLEAYGVLYKNGYSINSITSIAGLRSSNEISTLVQNKNLVTKLKQPKNFLEFTKEEKAIVHNSGLEDKVKQEYNVLREQGFQSVSKNVETILNIIDTDSIDEVEEPKKELVSAEKASVLEQEKHRIDKLVRRPDIDNVCSVCGNTGNVFIKTDTKFVTKNIVCPKCKGSSTKRKERTVGHVGAENKLLKELIPNHYFRNEIFNLMKLETEVPLAFDLKKEYAFKNYLKELETILNTFKVGLIPKNSYLLSAPDSFGKKHFIYSCIKECVLHGISCTPLYELSQIQGLLFEKKFLEVNDMLDKEVIFITVSGSGREIYPTAFKYLLDYCERYGKPLIMISRYESKNIMKHQAAFGGKIKLDWFDVFKESTFSYDYGHLLNIGITGVFAQNIYKERGQILENFTKFSPASMKFPQNHR